MRPSRSGTGVLSIDTTVLLIYMAVPIMLRVGDMELQVAGDVLLAACKVGIISGASLCRLQVAGCDCRHVQVAPAGNFPGSVAGFRMHGFVTDCFFLQVLEDIDPQVVSAWWALCWVQTLLPECQKEVGKGL